MLAMVVLSTSEWSLLTRLARGGEVDLEAESKQARRLADEGLVTLDPSHGARAEAARLTDRGQRALAAWD